MGVPLCTWRPSGWYETQGAEKAHHKFENSHVEDTILKSKTPPTGGPSHTEGQPCRDPPTYTGTQPHGGLATWWPSHTAAQPHRRTAMQRPTHLHGDSAMRGTAMQGPSHAKTHPPTRGPSHMRAQPRSSTAMQGPSHAGTHPLTQGPSHPLRTQPWGPSPTI